MDDNDLSRLAYNPKTGEIRWKVARSNNVKVGELAGCVAATGYRVIGIGDKLFLGHRIAWFLHHGEWPTKQLDHINGNRSDNRIENLRLATDGENKRNRGKQSNNRSGFKGVHLHNTPAGPKGWRASICVAGKRQDLGVFDTPQKAHSAYCTAVELYHGEFGRTQ